MLDLLGFFMTYPLGCAKGSCKSTALTDFLIWDCKAHVCAVLDIISELIITHFPPKGESTCIDKVVTTCWKEDYQILG